MKCSGKRELKDPTTHHCDYYDSTATESADAATSLCHGWRKNATLAAVTSAAEASFLTGTVGVKSGTWIGANDLAKSGSYQWVTGEAWSYTNWASGFPAGSPSAHCVRMGSQGQKWENVSCQSQNVTLCESSPEGKAAP